MYAFAVRDLRDLWERVEVVYRLPILSYTFAAVYDFRDLVLRRLVETCPTTGNENDVTPL